MLSKSEQIIADLKDADGSYDHEDIIQHLIYTAEIISDKAVNSDSESEMQSALINITCIMQAIGYMTIVRSHIQRFSKKGGAQC